MFESIGLHAALILNRLRNHQRIEAETRADQERRGAVEHDRENPRTKFEGLGDKKRSDS